MNEDKIIQEIMEIKEDIRSLKETSVTKDDFRELKGLVEEVVTITKKIREDHVFALEWLKRLQDKVDAQDKMLHTQDEEIRKIKMQLKIV